MALYLILLITATYVMADASVLLAPATVAAATQ